MANYKKASVVVLANATGTQTLTNAASGTKLLWTEVSDQTNYADVKTHLTNSTFTAPYAGFYTVTLSIYYGLNVTVGDGSFVTAIKNGSLAGGIILLQGAVAEDAVQNVSRMFKLEKNDTLSFYARQVSGGDRVPDATNTVLSIVRVGNAS
jgi:hypothetical protein